MTVKTLIKTSEYHDSVSLMLVARELSRRATGRTIYVLDEPSVGLHAADVHKLIEVLQRLVDAGNSVLIIEHNLDIIKVADYIIDLGPEGGAAGDDGLRRAEAPKRAVDEDVAVVRGGIADPHIGTAGIQFTPLEKGRPSPQYRVPIPNNLAISEIGRPVGLQRVPRSSDGDVADKDLFSV